MVVPTFREMHPGYEAPAYDALQENNGIYKSRKIKKPLPSGRGFHRD